MLFLGLMLKGFFLFPLPCMLTPLRYIVQNDVDLVHEIEALIGKQLDKFEYKEKEVLEDNITRVIALNHSRIPYIIGFANFHEV